MEWAALPMETGNLSRKAGRLNPSPYPSPRLIRLDRPALAPERSLNPSSAAPAPGNGGVRLVTSLRIAAVFLPLLILPGTARAMCDDWRTSDTLLAAGFSTLLYLDWRQTKQFTGPNQQPGVREENVVLGPHPSATVVDSDALAAMAGALVIGCLLPNPYRTGWFSVLIGVEIYAVNRNEQHGFRSGVAVHF
jgi:hypothetical protein